MLRWLNHALSVREDRRVYMQKVGLLGKMKNYPEARKAATSAITYLKLEKPDGDGWEHNMRMYEEKLRTWPK